MPPAPRPDHDCVPRQAQRELRILIADDERDAVLTLVSLLREEGHVARGAYHGNEVLSVIRQFEPDVVLLDIAMPDMTGWDVARKIREAYSGAGPKLIALTGVYTEGSDRILGRIVGFDYYLTKPYDPNALISLLADLWEPRGSDEDSGGRTT